MMKIVLKASQTETCYVHVHVCFFTDVDECVDRNVTCSQICTNVYGSYRCACLAGYSLDLDKHNCSSRSWISANNYSLH